MRSERSRSRGDMIAATPRGANRINEYKQWGNAGHGRPRQTPHISTARATRAESPVKRFFRATEIDTRLLGMVGAMLIIWIGFDFLSNGLFLTPRNLWNLSVQTASIAVMATGMVLVIVTRNIDLSVGSISASSA